MMPETAPEHTPDTVAVVAVTAAASAAALVHGETLKVIESLKADTIGAIDALNISGLRDEFRRFRDVEFVQSCNRNDKSNTEILDQVKRINSDVSTLMLWKSNLEGFAAGMGLTGKAAWAVLGMLVTVGCVVLGAALARGMW